MLQKVMYAKNKSNILAKLDGTFRIPIATNQNAEMTDLQQSIFSAPVPGSVPAAAPPALSGLPSKPQTAPANAEAPESRGQKRSREDEEEEEDSDVAMEEDSDDD